ncbi:polysaccharide deacetylase family protein [Adhaeretor mobilis]|nr:polysaccharide deacetylase family protein [Adhaeretor mobilis]
MSNSPEIVLTFDDGFLDNWTHVFPMAKRLGFKFTIFINPEFVDPRDIVRPTLDDVAAGKISNEKLDWWGFLSWPEMRIMEESGLVDIQSHTLTHTWHFSGEKIVDYHHPGDSYQWLTWNRHPETKPFWMNKFDEELVPFGTPIYEHGRSIAVRRYEQSREVDKQLAEFTAQSGGASFFEQADWRAQIEHEHKLILKDSAGTSRFETEAEHQDRVKSEVVDAKCIIEQKLNKEVRFVCWPGGAETELARQIALDSGHLATTKGVKPNAPSSGDPTHIYRVSSWFNAPIPMWLKWWILDGQFDRASQVRSLNAALASSLANLRRFFVQ